MPNKITWSEQTRKLSDLKPHPKNPRILTNQAHKDLSKSLDYFGLVDRPVINLDNTILAGHQRVAILIETGEQSREIPVLVPSRELTQVEADRFLLCSNRIHGKFDDDMLANNWEMDFLIDDCGFSELDFLGLEDEEETCTDQGDENKDKDPTICPKCHYEW